MVSAPIRQYRRRAASLLSIAFLSSALWLAAAAPTFACSCVEAQPMGAYATAEHAVFSGTAGPRDVRGVPVRVATWFSGGGAAPIVYLSAQSFTGEASCGTSVPPAGTDWIWVAYVPEGGGSDPVTGLCNPHGQLGSPEGDALLADATATFGGIAPPGAAATDPPERTPGSPDVPAEAGLPILLGTVGLALALLVGVVLLAQRVRPEA